MILAILAGLFLILAATACLALAGAAAYLVQVVAPAALEVAAIKRTGRPTTAPAFPKALARSVITKDATAVAEEISERSSIASDRAACELARADSNAAAPCATSAAVVPSHPANPAVAHTSSTKEIDIDTGFNYASGSSNTAVMNTHSVKEIDIDTGFNYASDCSDALSICWDAERDSSVCSSLNDSSPDLGMNASLFDEDDSFFLSLEVDSQFLQSGDLDVDWELESIASVHSSSSLNDTDYILGGESLDSDEESDTDKDLYLRGWSSDLDSVCSSLNDTDYLLGGESYESDLDASFVTSTCSEMEPQDVASVCSSKPEEDDQSTEDETDEEEEPQQNVQPINGAIQIARVERIACAVASGAVSVERGSRRSTPQTTLAANHTDSAAATVATKPVTPESADVPNAERVAAAEPVTSAPVRSRVYEYNTTARFVAQREARMARAQAIHEKSAAAKASRFL